MADLGSVLRAHGAPRRYQAGAFIFHQGDPSNALFVVDSGLVRVDRSTESGRVVLLTLVGPGAMIGEIGIIDGRPRSAAVSAIDESVLTRVSESAFRRAVRDTPGLVEELLGSVTGRLRRLTDQFEQATTMDATARLASRLVRLTNIIDARTDSGGTIDLRLPISQEELGQWAGLSREGAVKSLAALRRDGIIDTGRMRIRIHDLEGLAARASGG